MNQQKPVKDAFWTPARIASCGPIAHVITVEQVQAFAEDVYGRELTDEELNHVSLLFLENTDDAEFIDAAVGPVLSD